jgi:hypothetical protein
LKLFSFCSPNTSLHTLLAFKVSIEKSFILMGLPLYVIFFLFYNLQYSFSVLCAFCFNDNMPWEGSILVKYARCPGGFLYLNGQDFLEIWGILCYYFIDYIKYPFCLDLFCFFNAHDSQIWSFDGVIELLPIPFTDFELFD